MRIIITTSKPVEMKKQLELSSEQVKKQSHNMAEFTVTQIADNIFSVYIDYALENRIFNWRYKNALKKAIKKFDDKAEFEDVK